MSLKILFRISQSLKYRFKYKCDGLTCPYGGVIVDKSLLGRMLRCCYFRLVGIPIK
jgi:hypothetical protein